MAGLTDEQLHRFGEDGYLVVEDLLGEDSDTIHWSFDFAVPARRPAHRALAVPRLRGPQRRAPRAGGDRRGRVAGYGNRPRTGS